MHAIQVGQAIGALVAKGRVNLKTLAEHVLVARAAETETHGHNSATGQSAHVLPPQVLGLLHSLQTLRCLVTRKKLKSSTLTMNNTFGKLVSSCILGCHQYTLRYHTVYILRYHQPTTRWH